MYVYKKQKLKYFENCIRTNTEMIFRKLYKNLNWKDLKKL